MHTDRWHHPESALYDTHPLVQCRTCCRPSAQMQALHCVQHCNAISQPSSASGKADKGCRGARSTCNWSSLQCSLCAYCLDAWLHVQVHSGTQAHGPAATVPHIHAGQQAPAAQCRPGSTCQLCRGLSRLHCTGRSGNQPSCKPTAFWFF